MFNAVDSPQSILILGGSSEIGLAIASEFLVRGPARVILAVVPGDPTADAAADTCLLYTSPSPRDATLSRMPSSA